MSSKVFLLLGLLAIVFLISSEAASRDLAEKSAKTEHESNNAVHNNVEDAKYGGYPGGQGGYGGYPGGQGGYGGYPGGQGGYGGYPGGQGGYGGYPGGQGGYGGYPGGGRGGYGGGRYCRRCCDYGYRGGCRRCCYAGEKAPVENKP